MVVIAVPSKIKNNLTKIGAIVEISMYG